MKQNLRVSLGAVVLALATLAAMIFAWLNFVQRQTFEAPDDGVAWLDTASGAQAWKLAPNSPAARAGIRPGDLLIADRKSTRLNSSHANISYAVFCLKKKKKTSIMFTPTMSSRMVRYRVHTST